MKWVEALLAATVSNINNLDMSFLSIELDVSSSHLRKYKPVRSIRVGTFFLSSLSNTCSYSPSSIPRQRVIPVSYEE